MSTASHAALFFVDKVGDSSLSCADSPSGSPPATHPTTGHRPNEPQQQQQHDADFVSLRVSRNGRKRSSQRVGKKRDHRGRRAVAAKRWSPSPNHRSPDADAEEMAAAMLDYIQNASLGDDGDLSTIVNLASLPDLSAGEGSDSDEAGVEVGRFEALMLGLDVDGEDSESAEESDASTDHDSDLAAFEKLGFGSDSDGDVGGDLRAEEAYLTADFQGGPSAWDGGRRADAGDRKFHRILRADFSTAGSDDDDEDGTTTTTGGASAPSRTQRRKVARRERGARMRERAQAQLERETAGRQLSACVARSKGRVNQDLTAFLGDLNASMRSFVRRAAPDGPTTLVLPAMPGAVRRLACAMAREYRLTPKTRGKGGGKVTVLIRTQRSTVPEGWKALVGQVVAAETVQGRMKGNIRQQQQHGEAGRRGATGRKKPKPPGAPNDEARPKMGTVVGEGTAPIGDANIGHRMLKAMGWNPGQALGADGSGGLVDPVQVTVRSRRSGLGNAI